MIFFSAALTWSGDLPGEVVSFGKVLFGEFAQTLFAENAHVDSGHQGEQGLVGTDVRSGFFAADVLFASGEGETEGAVTGSVGGFSDETAGELANVFFARSDDANVGTAVAGRDGEALQFTDDDIGFTRRLNETERNGFGKSNNE